MSRQSRNIVNRNVVSIEQIKRKMALYTALDDAECPYNETK